MILLIPLFFLIFTKTAFAQSSDPTVTPFLNPSSGIILNEIMPEADSKWVEIYNSNNFPIILENWQLDDIESGGCSPKTLGVSIAIPALSYYTYDYTQSCFNNNTTDSVRLINNLNNQIDIFTYNNTSSSYSWSKQSDGNWCLAIISKGQNNNSCFIPTSTPIPPTATPIPPTPTPVPPTATPIPPTSTLTQTPTITPTKTPTITPTPTDEPIPTAVIEPLDITTILIEETPSPTPTITQIPAQELILGEPTTNKKNPLPLIFICIGALFLLAPLIIAKIKHED